MKAAYKKAVYASFCFYLALFAFASVGVYGAYSEHEETETSIEVAIGTIAIKALYADGAPQGARTLTVFHEGMERKYVLTGDRGRDAAMIERSMHLYSE